MINHKHHYNGLTAQPSNQQYAGQGFLPLRQQSMGYTNKDYTPEQQIEMVEQNELSMSQSAPGALLRKSGLEILEDRQGVFLKQKLQVIGAITGCETQNTYFVYPLDEEAEKKGHKLFKCQEKSGFCARNCVSSNARPFKMTISTFRRGEDLKDEYEPFLQLERPCMCTFLCYNRPELSVTLIEDGKSEYLGKIVDPFTWCDLRADIYDKDDTKTYSVEGNCCQLGVIYRAPCEPCQTVSFDVKNSSGGVVSTLQKRSPGCLKAAFSDVNNFTMNFPVGATAVDRALILCSTLLIHYAHFERKGG